MYYMYAQTTTTLNRGVERLIAIIAYVNIHMIKLKS